MNAKYKSDTITVLVMDLEYDHLLKLAIIGDCGVGKSSLMLRYSDNTFSDRYISSVGVNFTIKIIDVNGEKVKLQIWDTAGGERWKAIRSSYYGISDGFIVVYDVTKGTSFDNVQQWLHEINQTCVHVVTSILVGNKDDDAASKVVLTQDAQEFADQMGIQLFEISVKEDKNVHEMFDVVTKLVLSTKKERQKKLAEQSHDS